MFAIKENCWYAWLRWYCFCGRCFVFNGILNLRCFLHMQKKERLGSYQPAIVLETRWTRRFQPETFAGSECCYCIRLEVGWVFVFGNNGLICWVHPYQYNEKYQREESEKECHRKFLNCPDFTCSCMSSYRLFHNFFNLDTKFGPVYSTLQ